MDVPKLLTNHDSSIPLIARLDHLEFIMKFLERKQRCGNNVVIAEKSSLDSSSAVKEDFFKGTLLDRVASLEHRLSQLCTEMDSSGSSNPISRASTQATSGESSSSQGSKGEIYYSFPTFNNLPNTNNTDKDLMSLNHTKTCPLPLLTEISESVVQQQPKKSCPPKQEVVVVKNNKSKKKEKKNNHKGEKKQVAPVSWPHLKLLGC